MVKILNDSYDSVRGTPYLTGEDAEVLLSLLFEIVCCYEISYYDIINNIPNVRGRAMDLLDEEMEVNERAYDGSAWTA